MLELLGPIRLALDGAERDLGGPRQRLVLTMLGIDANRVVSATRLVDAVWNGDAPDDPRAALQVAVSRLRRSLGEDIGSIEYRAPGYVLHVERHSVDVHRFTTLVEQGTAALGDDLRRGAHLLREALALVRGEPFGDLAEHPALAQEAARIEELRLRALQGRIDADMRLGRHADVVDELQGLARTHPLREVFWELLMRALHASGRHADALQAYEWARTVLRDELGADPSPTLRQLHELVLRQDPRLDPVDRAAADRGDTTPIRNPYKGLRAFSEEDAADFFGREGQVRALLERLDSRGADGRLLVLVGPSGSGKSSLVRAGLVPALRRGDLSGSDRWLVATILPGRYPADELERALVELGEHNPEGIRRALAEPEVGLADAVALVATEDRTELVLVIDQFEELVQLADDGQRTAFIALLRSALNTPTCRLRIVLTVRADVFDDLLLEPGVGGLAATNTFVLAPPDRDALERAIVRPARAVGVKVTAEATADMLAEVEEAPGALPMLQYALTELFDRCSGDRITAADLRALGGIHGAIAGRAEELWASLGSDARDVCRQVLLRLVVPGEHHVDTRRRVHRDELSALSLEWADGDDRLVTYVLELLGRHRLVTFDTDPRTGTPTVELAHEALLRAWDRFADWVDDGRHDMRMRHRLASARAEWVDANRHDGFLLQDARLDEFVAWSTETELALTTDERAFLDASRATAERRDAEDRARTDREEQLERRSLRRLRVIAVLSVVAAVVAAGLTAVTLQERDRAHAQTAVAQRQELLARIRAVTSAAVAELDDDPERSVLLAMEAMEMARVAGLDPLPESQSALRRALPAVHVAKHLPSGSGLDVAASGHVATLGADGTATVWDPERWTTVAEQPGQATPRDVRLAGAAVVTTVGLSADGRRLVTTTPELRAVVRDVATGDPVTELEGRVVRPQFSPDDASIIGVAVQEPTAGFDAGRSIGIWDATTGVLELRLDGHTANVEDHATSPDGRHLVTTGQDSTALWDLASGQELWRTDTLGPAYGVAYHPAGDRVAVGTESGLVHLLDASDGAELATLDGHTAVVRGVAFDPAGTRLVTAGFGDGDARIWDLATNRKLMVLQGEDAIWDTAFLPDGDHVLTTTITDRTTVWDVRFPGGRSWGTLEVAPSPSMLRTDFAPSSHVVAVGRPEGGVELVDVGTMEAITTLATSHVVDAFAWNDDGTQLATAGGAGERDVVELWDPSTGRRIRELPGPFTAGGDIDLNPDGELLVHGGTDGIVRAVDSTTGEQRWRYDHPLGRIYTVAVTPDGSGVVVGAQDAAVVLDAATGAVRHELDVTASVTDVAFVDGKVTVGALGTGYLRFDLDTGERLDTVVDGASIGSLDVQDGLLVTEANRVVFVRDLATGEIRFELTVAGDVTGLRVSDDGRFLAVVVPGRVDLHVLPVDDLLALARERVARSLTDAECLLHLQPGCVT